MCAVVGVMLATVLQAVDGSIVNVALPQIQQKLGGSLGHVGWTITGYAVASLIAMPLAARVAARTGLRAYFAGSVAVFTLASARCPFYLLRQLGGALGVALCASALDAFGTRGSVASFAALALAAPLSLLPMATAESRRRASRARAAAI